MPSSSSSTAQTRSYALPKKRVSVGSVYGNWTVLSYSGSRKTDHGSEVYWRCRCGCGTEQDVRANRLTSGEAVRCKKCANQDRPVKDITGQRFGTLVVLGRAPKKHAKETVTRWYIRCDCGIEKDVLKNSLLNGTTRSCGCAIPKKGQYPKNRKPPSSTNPKNIVGNVYGRLKVLVYTGKQAWLCRCSCGNYTKKKTQSLKRGNPACPACLREIASLAHIKDISGEKYGSLLVLSPAESRGKEWYWNVRCDCGQEHQVRGSHLRAGTTVRCRMCQARNRRVENPKSGYPAEFSLSLRRDIRKRDNRICQYCNQRIARGQLDVHHIDHDRTNNDPMNLVSLCNPCHYKMHKKDSDKWVPYWKGIMQARFSVTA